MIKKDFFASYVDHSGMLKQLDGSLSLSIAFDSWLGTSDRNLELAVLLLNSHFTVLSALRKH